MNAQLRRIQDVLRKEAPDVSPEVANKVQWKVWHSLFKDSDYVVDDAQLRSDVMKGYYTRLRLGQHYGAYWDPYKQK